MASVSALFQRDVLDNPIEGCESQSTINLCNPPSLPFYIPATVFPSSTRTTTTTEATTSASTTSVTIDVMTTTSTTKARSDAFSSQKLSRLLVVVMSACMSCSLWQFL